MEKEGVPRKNWDLFVYAWGVTKLTEPIRLGATLILLKPLKQIFLKVLKRLK
jgi:hypothetical protein